MVTVNNPVDSTPAAFNFSAQTGIAPNTVATSNTITPTGYNTASTISVSEGASYSIDRGAFVTAPGTISPGQSVAVRQTCTDAFNTVNTATLTIGGVVRSYTATTRSGTWSSKYKR